MYNRQISWDSLEGHPLRVSPKWTLRQSIFSTAELGVPVFYDISRDLTDKYFGIVWGCHHPQGPHQMDPKNKVFERPKLGC